MSSLNALQIRRYLGRSDWGPPEPFGPDGWRFIHKTRPMSIIASVASFDGAEWIHASIAHSDRMPTYDELTTLHAAVFGDRYAYQCFVPSADHVNIHQHALHLWGRLDGAPVLPQFAMAGSI